MSDAGDPLTVEGTGDTVGEARWAALRELERQVGTVDPAVVEIVVVSRGRARACSASVASRPACSPRAEQHEPAAPERARAGSPVPI